MAKDFDDFARTLQDDPEYQRRLDSVMNEVAFKLEHGSGTLDIIEAAKCATEDISLLQLRMYHEWTRG